MFDVVVVDVDVQGFSLTPWTNLVTQTILEFIFFFFFHFNCASLDLIKIHFFLEK